MAGRQVDHNQVEEIAAEDQLRCARSQHGKHRTAPNVNAERPGAALSASSRDPSSSHWHMFVTPFGRADARRVQHDAGRLPRRGAATTQRRQQARRPLQQVARHPYPAEVARRGHSQATSTGSGVVQSTSTTAGSRCVSLHPARQNRGMQHADYNTARQDKPANC